MYTTASFERYVDLLIGSPATVGTSNLAYVNRALGVGGRSDRCHRGELVPLFIDGLPRR